MVQVIKLRRSPIPGHIPTATSIQLGELAINTSDGKLFLAKTGITENEIVEVLTTNTYNTGNLNLGGNMVLTGGTYSGDGSDLYNIPYSGLSGSFSKTINGTIFDGTANIITSFWGTGRTITIGSTGKSVNGSADVSWSLSEIGVPSLTGSGATGTWPISITGSTATLATPRLINNTSFNGSADITTALWGTGRTITIGSTGKSVNGSTNVSWSLAEIGAFATPTGLTTNYITKWNGTALTNSLFFDDGTNIGLNTNAPTEAFELLTPTGLVVRQTQTANTNNATRWYGGAYTGNKTTIMVQSATLTNNQIVIGGGTSGGEAATVIDLNTSPSIGTLGSGITRVRINADGNFGLGTTTLTGFSFRNSKVISGSVSSYANYSDGVIQSDVTSNAYYYRTLASTLATGFTLTNLYHYIADQTTIGAGSTVTNQYGFYVSSLLVGATNNYGIFSNIPSGSNRWNLYMGGTASNYLAGALGIGTTTLTGFNLSIQKTGTGAVLSRGIYQSSQIQSDVTSAYRYNETVAATQATTFTLTELSHYAAIQGTFGAGSTITNQYGFIVSSTLVGATNNYGFYGNIPSGSNRWNLYMNGTADNYIAGSLGIGSTSLTGFNLRIDKNISGASTSIAVFQTGDVQSGITASYGFRNDMNIVASASVTSYTHYDAREGTFGAGASITTQTAFLVASNITNATNNYGFRGSIPSGSNRWNIYMDGTANNYLEGSLGIGVTVPLVPLDTRGVSAAISALNTTPNGTVLIGSNSTSAALSIGVNSGTYGFIQYRNRTGDGNAYPLSLNPLGGNIYLGSDGLSSVGIGTTSLTGYNLRVSKTLSGASSAFGIYQDGAVQTGVTVTAYGVYNSLNTQAASFTLPAYIHYTANQATLGSGSAVTTQYGFFVNSNLTGATTNIGFYGNIPSGSNRWNIHMNGTASNYLAGALGIGSTSLTGFNVRVSKTINGNSGVGYGVLNDGVVQSDVNSQGYGITNNFSTQATAFTIPDYYHFFSRQVTIGAGSTVTNQYGFTVSATLVGATNNYGFYGNIPSGSGRWNLFMVGSANNYMVGSLGIGTTSLTGYILNIAKNGTGAPIGKGIYQSSEIQSDVTTHYRYNETVAFTAPVSFTLTELSHYVATQSTFGAGSTVTNQYGFLASSTLVGATNNYAFYGDIASGSNRWNLYMNGTADNYIKGNLGIDVANPTYKFQVTTGSGGAYFTRTSGDTGAIAPALGLVTASTTTRIYSYADALQFFLAATGGTANNIMELKSNGTLYIGTSSADTSALLHVSSTTKGVLFPQMTTTQINAISSPANGLLVYNTTLNKLCVYESGSWKQMTTTTM